MHQEITVLIIGAGPAGLATSACLNLKNIPNIVLEKEEVCASLWKKRGYDRLKLHLAKQFCELPNMPFPPNAPTFVSKNSFIRYLDDYVSHFNVTPLYNRTVECAIFDQSSEKWFVTVNNTSFNVTEKYESKFLIVATGENSEGFIPPIRGLDTFQGEIIHSNSYENGKRFGNKNVLVVGCGNSGMEIAFDLFNWKATTSIVVRSPIHILNERMVQLGMVLLKYISLDIVDNIVLMLSKLWYGDLSDYGITRPSKGPFYLKKLTGRSPVIEVGTIDKIRTHEINVLPAINEVSEEYIHFTSGERKRFDAIVFATGYKSTVRKWLKSNGGLFNEDGMPNKRNPDHWKGENGLYCVGFGRAGLFGISADAQAVAREISSILY